MKRILFISMMLLLALAGCAPAQAEAPLPASVPVVEAVVVEGQVVPVRHLRQSFTARGTVAEILVAEGQLVRAGEVLARLGDREQAQAALAAAELELISAQQAYDEFQRSGGLINAQAWQAYLDAQVARAAAQRAWEVLDLDAIDDAIDDAQAEVEDRKTDLDDAQEEFDKYKDLNENNATREAAEDALRDAENDYNESLRALDAARSRRDSVRAALDAALTAEAEARRKFEQTSSGADADRLALLEARLNAAKLQAQAAQNALDGYEIRAAFAGVVTDIPIKAGQFVGPETWAIQLADFSAWLVETTDLNELEVVQIAEGQPVEITPDAVDVTLPGTVQSIGQSFKTQGGDVIYTVKIKLDETHPDLRWGMTVEVAFPVE